MYCTDPIHWSRTLSLFVCFLYEKRFFTVFLDARIALFGLFCRLIDHLLSNLPICYRRECLITQGRGSQTFFQATLKQNIFFTLPMNKLNEREYK